jgi:predicted membrane protein (TIGR00267 family)
LGKKLEQIVEIISSNKKAWLDIMMTEELNLPPKKFRQPREAAIVVGASAFAGSIFPLIPFFLLPAQQGMWIALLLSIIVLFAAGAIKARITKNDWKKSGLELAIIGLTAAIAGYAIGLILGVTV